MAKSLDKVLQADGSYKWELVDSWNPDSEKKAEASAKPAAKAKTTRKTKASKVEE
nr:hypothetical protein [uncultured Mediterranean phage uvMED]BAR24125.1 hypothetical protein [uncultured Mediterranean phage uvMED]|tara:strand:+ start:634 stop:798 length:165 start_codon:yes stop_codon:yes gene_type:complete